MKTPYQVTSTTYIDTTKTNKNEETTLVSSINSLQKTQNPNELSEDAKRAISELQARDTEVRAHEAAHQAAGGGMTGGASYSYQKGPDGRMYAIGGEVSISTKGGSTPEESIANARQVQAAAMAPANPSGQDFAVANSAKVMEIKAQQELAKEQQTQMRGEKEYGDASKQNSDDLTNNNADPLQNPNQEYKPFDISA